jgi:transglutaminase-like putative cysteine protease
MRLSIRHQTLYRYSAPLVYTIQQLRLTPRGDAHQHVDHWHITTSGHRHAFGDAFGNECHMLTVRGRFAELSIVAEGIVDIAPLDRGRLTACDTVSPLVFTMPTSRTEPTAEVRAFAAQYLPVGSRSEDLLALAQAVRGAVVYQSGATDVTFTAAEALQLGSGVCQDHAHLFIACCHTRGIAARYVSGYIDPGRSDHAETHAWVDVWIEEPGYTGWVSLDVTHGRFANDALCRLAVGRDYESSAPVRGVRRGGGVESLQVRVTIQNLK